MCWSEATVLSCARGGQLLDAVYMVLFVKLVGCGFNSKLRKKVESSSQDQRPKQR